MNSLSSNSEQAVTVVISRRVKPGHEAEFEDLCTRLTQAASQFDGYQGSNLFRPATVEDPEYRIIFRFANEQQLKIWNDSPERSTLVGRIETLLSSPTQRDISYGIAGWFELPVRTVSIAPPPRYKMTLVSWMALYPIVTLVFLIFGPWLQQVPLLLRTLLVTALVMVLMSYVAMPRMTRWFRPWLFNGR
ncbi:antibiotic biosynthesis monooxygenase [Parathalassolituus penaei]|uniref:Antibiotic biosynthesis monooxygenase n=1 Tax=Parathalassolituus penaei TaxID=2997323 RepID=A0A9X3IRD0_9GAMM|nr:antibiotic biosynthesis monooxygenase [Parathalassolituus penaei]MCY0964746.1 antibiotic biosynthesis monooxygenase [Parathalassolituus penaei]